MSQLPSAWAHAPIGSICVETEQVTPESEVEFAYIDIGSVDRFKKKVMAPQRLLGKDAPSRARKRIRAGDTIVSTTRPNLNAVALVDQSLDGQIASTGFEVLRAPGLDPRWLGYLVRTSAFVNAMTSLVQGALYPAVRGKDVRSFVAPIAPGNEQKRIADKLDTVLTRVDAVNTRLARVAPILKRFRQSVLAAATSGRLTEDWRVLNSTSKPWRKATLEDLIEEMRNGLAAKPDESQAGRKILRISAVRPGFLDTTDHRYLTTDESSAKLYELRKGDLLFTRYNGSLEYVGVCAMVSEDLPGYVYPDKLIRVRVKASVALPKFIELVSSAAEARLQIEGYVKSSAGQKGISGGSLRTLRMAVPPVEEQTEIVRRVETLFAFADRLQARLQAAQTATERLPPALLAKAFRGELVPQDPNDEPATELLRRLASKSPALAPRRGREMLADSST